MSQSLFEFLAACISDERLQRFEEVLQNRTRRLTLVLENIYHEHNASACLRTADCFGLQDVHVIESENTFAPNPDIALGASKWLSIHRYPKVAVCDPAKPNAATAECYAELRKSGYRIVATSPRQNSRSLDEVKLDARTAVVLGAEQVGVSDYAIENADELIHIPMYGFTESFNVSVSAAIILRELTRQLHATQADWHLCETEKQAIREVWVRQSLGSQTEPLCRRYELEQSAK